MSKSAVIKCLIAVSWMAPLLAWIMLFIRNPEHATARMAATALWVVGGISSIVGYLLCKDKSNWHIQFIFSFCINVFSYLLAIWLSTLMVTPH
jgi:hypothetical protein